MIKLTGEMYVRAEDVSEVSINRDAGTVTVRMKNGIGHHVPNDYGKSVYDTVDRLIKEIEAEVSK